MAVEALAWPIPPTSTNVDDGGTNYILGVSFGVDEAVPCPGVRWRVPDSLITPNAPASAHYAVLWRLDSPNALIRSQAITPTPGGEQDFLWTAGPVDLDPAFDYLVGVLLVKFAFSSAGGVWNFRDPSNRISALAGRLVATSDPTTFPSGSADSYYYVSPLVGTVEAPAIEGTATIALPALDLLADGAVVNPGQAALTLPAVDLLAAGGVDTAGTAAITLPALDLLAAGAVGPTGDSAITLPAVDLFGTGTVSSTGTAGLTLPPLGLVVTGVAEQPVNTGSAAIILPPIVLSASSGVAGPSAPTNTLATASRPRSLATASRPQTLITGTPPTS